MNKQYRLKQIKEEIEGIEWMAFWTGTKEAENRLRQLKQEQSELEMELEINNSK